MNSAIIKEYVARHNVFLRHFVEQADIPAPRLKEALLYSLFPGGKRLRPILVYLCGELVDANIESLDSIAAAIELMHCYSLVHDDLPAMDNDDFRRGRATCHRAFDDATAILVGDGMQGLATELLLTQLPSLLPERAVIQILRELITSCGFSGMISGQSLDLSELSRSHITEKKLRYIHHLKTGALFSACINMVLYSGAPSEITSTSLSRYADILGIVFQMQDDYNDRHSSIELLGKNRASDEANQKTTYASLFDKQDLLDLIDQYYEKAHLALAPLGSRANALVELTRVLHQRTQEELT